MTQSRIEVLETEMETLSVKINEMQSDCAKQNLSWDEYLEASKSLRIAYNKAYDEYRLLQTPEMEPIPDYGDHMTMGKFVRYCKDGGFIDYDGSGNYATATEMSDISVSPSDIMSGVYRKDFTHVVWFNK